MNGYGKDLVTRMRLFKMCELERRDQNDHKNRDNNLSKRLS